LIEDLPLDAAPVRFISEPDSGLYDAMNKGAAIAKGDYLVFLMSDDYFNTPDALAALGAEIRKGGHDYIYGRQISLDEAGNTHLWKNMSPTLILNQMPFGHTSIAFRRDMLIALKGYDTHYNICADYDFVFRMIGAGYRGKHLKYPIGVFRAGGVSGDLEQVRFEHMTIWRTRLADYVDMADISDDKVLNWLRRGQFPLWLLWSVFRQSKTSGDLKKACIHAAFKSLRRIAKPRKNS
ncbi:MAG: glycosyltransferase, partial [Proteobacteria bacterium]|nr:glycosyltransferase [Pseudomonadota bacterium]